MTQSRKMIKITDGIIRKVDNEIAEVWEAFTRHIKGETKQ